MNAARADALWAQRQLDEFGWIARNAESFRHLPPPSAAVWLGDASAHVADCDATPLEGAGWNLQPIGALPQGRVDARWLDAADPSQRAELFAGLALPDGDEAAPFSWAHRSLCRRGLRLRLEAGDGATPTVWLQLRHAARDVVDAPMLVVDVLPGVRCVLVEIHERESSSCHCALVQNLQVHLRLAHGSTMQHLRIVTPGADDRLAHHVHVRIDGDAHYHQALLASGSSYHLQRNVFELQGTRAAAQAATVMLAAGNTTLEQQVRTHHKAAQTQSSIDVLALAEGNAQVVVNAYTHIAPGADDADVRQRLSGIATGGQPKIVLRPHLEIHHDQVQAAHGATCGALDEEALFYAGQRGLSAPLARSLMVQGMAHAVLSRGLEAGEWMNHLDIDPLLARQVQRHLGSAVEASHG
ncbi:MAG: SufD family Fe-S cluster assembly protein [Burkholderiaceae bacterium]